MTKEGKILKALSGFYYVDCSGEVITCRARGNFRNENITPLVGDDVKIQLSDNNTGYVVEILERKNELLRPKVANIDYSIIVVSVITSSTSIVTTSMRVLLILMELLV